MGIMMTVFLLENRALPFSKTGDGAKSIWAVSRQDFQTDDISQTTKNWAKSAGFEGQEGKFLLVPNENGELIGALFGLGDQHQGNPFASGALAKLLPEGTWRLQTSTADLNKLSMGFGMGAYQFTDYKSSSKNQPLLSNDNLGDTDDLNRQLAGVFLARDLINIPTNDMGPDALEKVFCDLAKHYGATAKVIKGDDLLDEDFPLIHTVGRASHEEPRLLDMSWGHEGDPKITLVGKGVCFDTGGLDIKPASAMGLMKKDMGGAANVLALALMIMDAKLAVRLRVLVPAVENSISANAFRPSDILTSRKGLTVQIDNTDAEGRLVLADALTLASEEEPDMIIDMATLTGAARVALGPDLPPFYTDDEGLASEIHQAGLDEDDPVWRMPLYKGYEADVATRIADLTNAPSGGFAGSITAALFLKRFVSPDISWVHFDIYGWNPKERPHSSIGGEAQAIRSLYRVLKDRYLA
jgi:leucyl aminopeptidase